MQFLRQRSGVSNDPYQVKRPSPFERIGGKEGVEAIVVEFYRRVIADPELAEFFADTDLNHLLAMQREYVTIALGGEATISPAGLRDAHAGRGIRSKQFLRFLALFMDTIRDRNFDETDLDAVLDRMAMAATDVLDSPTEAG